MLYSVQCTLYSVQHCTPTPFTLYYRYLQFSGGNVIEAIACTTPTDLSDDNTDILDEDGKKINVKASEIPL